MTSRYANALGIWVLLYLLLGVTLLFASPTWVLHPDTLGVHNLRVHPLPLASHLILLWVIYRFWRLAPKRDSALLLRWSLSCLVIALAASYVGLSAGLGALVFAVLDVGVWGLLWAGVRSARWVGAKTAWVGACGVALLSIAGSLAPLWARSTWTLLVGQMAGLGGGVASYLALAVVGVHLLRWRSDTSDSDVLPRPMAVDGRSA